MQFEFEGLKAILVLLGLVAIGFAIGYTFGAMS